MSCPNKTLITYLEGPLIMRDIMRDVRTQRSHYSLRPRRGFCLLLCVMRVKPYPDTYPCLRQYIYIYMCLCRVDIYTWVLFHLTQTYAFNYIRQARAVITCGRPASIKWGGKAGGRTARGSWRGRPASPRSVERADGRASACARMQRRSGGYACMLACLRVCVLASVRARACMWVRDGRWWASPGYGNHRVSVSRWGSLTPCGMG